MLILDGESGELVTSIEYPQCQSVEIPQWSPDGRYLAVSSGFDGCEREGVRHWIEVFETTTWQSVVVLPSPTQGGPGSGSPLGVFDETGRLFVLTAGGPAEIYAAETFEKTATLSEAIGLALPNSSGMSTPAARYSPVSGSVSYFRVSR